MKDMTIGVLGGMGTYATINLFQQYAEVFNAEKEWERPRIIIDNRCTMPSRVRAFLYNEKKEQLVDEMADSMQNLVKAGCNRIILACNTSYLFLEEIYNKAPELKNYVINIIYNCVDVIKANGNQSVYLLGSEGTIESNIYQNSLKVKGIKCITPSRDEYFMLRECIEAVKQNKYGENIKKIFLKLVNKYDTCILGCTELPILYKMYKNDVKCSKLYDPLLLGIIKLKEEYMDE